MNSPQIDTNNAATEVAHVQAHYTANRKLGHWTTARKIEVRAMRGHVVLDLRSPQIPAGDIEIELLADRTTVKLLVPEDAVIDSWDLQMVGRGKVKDRRFQETPESRHIKITGELRRGEIRVHRGGVATLVAMFTREYAEDVFRAHREGTVPTMSDPATIAPDTPRPARDK
jgi:hypothetical protein